MITGCIVAYMVFLFQPNKHSCMKPNVNPWPCATFLRH